MTIVGDTANRIAATIPAQAERRATINAASGTHKVPATIAGSRASIGEASLPIACSHSE